MTINWFSALPPRESAGATLTRKLVPVLAREAKLILWSNESASEPALEADAERRVYDPGRPPWGEFNRAELTVFNLGDDVASFGPIWTISRRLPGVVILHEPTLSRFFVHLLADKGFLTPLQFLALAELHHPNVGRVAVELYLSGAIDLDELARRCPLTGAATANALATIVPAQGSAPDAAGLLRIAAAVSDYQATWCARVMGRRVGEALGEWVPAEEPPSELLSRVTDEIQFLNT